MNRNLRGLFAVCVVSALATGSAMAADPAAICQASKLGTSAKYASCRLKAESKAVKAGSPVDYSRCSLGRFADAEAKATPGVCPTEGDLATIQGVLEECTSRAAQLLDVGRFVDNGDGTVTDNRTGLMWEQKTTAVGSGADFSNPHDVDNFYPWSSAPGTTAPDGTAFTDFLDKLNGQAGIGTGFAGYYDWRLPTLEELQGIVDILAPGCGSGSPCINAVFGGTATYYWSSATASVSTDAAWYVDFADGTTDLSSKANPIFVRAVRTGS